MILKLTVRSGNVQVKEENNEGPIIIILKHLRSCYVNNNDINNNICTLLKVLLLGTLHTFHVIPMMMYYYHPHLTDKDIGRNDDSWWTQEFIQFRLLFVPILSTTIRSLLCE